jgi:hypothetical protein
MAVRPYTAPSRTPGKPAQPRNQPRDSRKPKR